MAQTHPAAWWPPLTEASPGSEHLPPRLPPAIRRILPQRYPPSRDFELLLRRTKSPRNECHDDRFVELPSDRDEVGDEVDRRRQVADESEQEQTARWALHPAVKAMKEARRPCGQWTR